MASFPGGVVILTAFGDDHQPRGLTVSAFCAASLDPPLALVCIDKKSNTLPAVQHTGGFPPQILVAGREHPARPMATNMSANVGRIRAHPPRSKIRAPLRIDHPHPLAGRTLPAT